MTYVYQSMKASHVSAVLMHGLLVTRIIVRRSPTCRSSSVHHPFVDHPGEARGETHGQPSHVRPEKNLIIGLIDELGDLPDSIGTIRLWGQVFRFRCIAAAFSKEVSQIGSVVYSGYSSFLHA